MTSSGRVAAMAALVLSLAGCVAVPPPAATQADVDDYRSSLLERTWQNTGLPGPAPSVVAAPARPMLETMEPISVCFADNGLLVASWGAGGPEGHILDEVQNKAEPSADDLRTFYICMASNPYEISTDDVLSRAQADFVYDYFQSWVVPCLLNHHYAVGTVPTRAEFTRSNGQWSPYWAANLPTTAAYERAVELCGAERPPLE